MTPRDKSDMDSTSGSSQHIDAGHTEVTPASVSDTQVNIENPYPPKPTQTDEFVRRLRSLYRYWIPVANAAKSVPGVMWADVERVIAELQDDGRTAN